MTVAAKLVGLNDNNAQVLKMQSRDIDLVHDRLDLGAEHLPVAIKPKLSRLSQGTVTTPNIGAASMDEDLN